MNIFKPLVMLDRMFLVGHQYVADKVQSWVGLTNFDLSRISAVMWAMLCYQFPGDKKMSFQDHLMTTSFSALIAFLLVFMVEARVTKRRDDVGVRNNLEICPFFSILRMLTMLLMEINLLGLILVIPESGEYLCKQGVYLVYLYFISCTPKPPSKSKLQRGVEALGRVLSRGLSPATAVPVSAR